MSLIDLHTHTRHGSVCGYQSSDELVTQAKKVGLDGVCITEHDGLWDTARIERLREKYGGFLVINGVEVMTDHGEVLVYGLHKLPLAISRLEEIRKRVDDVGGVMVVAHPFRGLASTRAGLEEPLKMVEAALTWLVFKYADDLEVLNGASVTWERKLGMAVAERLNMKGTGGSDAHNVTAVGACYTCFDNDVKSEEDLVREIKAHRFHADNNLIFNHWL